MQYQPPSQVSQAQLLQNEPQDTLQLPMSSIMDQLQENLQTPISEQTAYMRWSTELEKQDGGIIDNDFIQRHRGRIIDINKFLPLSNITNPTSIKLFHLRRINMELAHDAGLLELEEELALDNVADYNTTRGQNGFFQRALITTRQELDDNQHNTTPQGWLQKIRSHYQRPTQQDPMQGYNWEGR